MFCRCETVLSNVAIILLLAHIDDYHRHWHIFYGIIDLKDADTIVFLSFSSPNSFISLPLNEVLLLGWILSIQEGTTYQVPIFLGLIEFLRKLCEADEDTCNRLRPGAAVFLLDSFRQGRVTTCSLFFR